MAVSRQSKKTPQCSNSSNSSVPVAPDRVSFAKLREPLEVGRYHSLVADPALPDALQRSAFAEQIVMAVRHRELPAEGVQFHPESVMTEQGRDLLRNFLQRTR